MKLKKKKKICWTLHQSKHLNLGQQIGLKQMLNQA